MSVIDEMNESAQADSVRDTRYACATTAPTNRMAHIVAVFDRYCERLGACWRAEVPVKRLAAERFGPILGSPMPDWEAVWIAARREAGSYAEGDLPRVASNSRRRISAVMLDRIIPIAFPG